MAAVRLRKAFRYPEESEGEREELDEEQQERVIEQLQSQNDVVFSAGGRAVTSKGQICLSCLTLFSSATPQTPTNPTNTENNPQKHSNGLLSSVGFGFGSSRSARRSSSGPVFGPGAAIIVRRLAMLGFNYQKSSSSIVNSTLYALRTSPRAREILGDEIYFAQQTK
jgi:hypothetical protein